MLQKKQNHISFKILDTSIPRLTYSTLSDDPYDMYIKLFFHFAVWGQVKVKPIAHSMCGCLDSFSLDFQFSEVEKSKPHGSDLCCRAMNNGDY